MEITEEQVFINYERGTRHLDNLTFKSKKVRNEINKFLEKDGLIAVLIKCTNFIQLDFRQYTVLDRTAYKSVSTYQRFQDQEYFGNEPKLLFDYDNQEIITVKYKYYKLLYIYEETATRGKVSLLDLTNIRKWESINAAPIPDTVYYNGIPETVWDVPKTYFKILTLKLYLEKLINV